MPGEIDHLLSGLRVRISLSRIEIDARDAIELGYPESELHIRESTAVPSQRRGTLPPSAKPNDFKHEQHAHAAAALVRDERIRPETAFARVAPTEVMRKPESIRQAIRKAYEKMYDDKGMPINQN